MSDSHEKSEKINLFSENTSELFEYKKALDNGVKVGLGTDVGGGDNFSQNDCITLDCNSDTGRGI